MPGGPGQTQCGRFEAVSVGVFEWISRANGKGVKRGPVKVRVRGSDPVKISRKAKEICDELDVGAYRGPKTVVARD